MIENGLTGIVGPNGCGKSNIVEALRWCMGETSAKSMRGAGMEDVIFSGTANRSSKNIAEVSLLLDNLEKKSFNTVWWIWKNYCKKKNRKRQRFKIFYKWKGSES